MNVSPNFNTSNKFLKRNYSKYSFTEINRNKMVWTPLIKMQSALHSDISLANKNETYRCRKTTFSVDFVPLFPVIHIIIQNHEVDCFLKFIFLYGLCLWQPESWFPPEHIRLWNMNTGKYFCLYFLIFFQLIVCWVFCGAVNNEQYWYAYMW